MLGGLSSGVFEFSSSTISNAHKNKLNPDEVVMGMWGDTENTKKSNDEIENGVLARRGEGKNEDVKIDEDAFVDGLWGREEKVKIDDGAESVEKSQLESVENIDDSGIIKESKVLTIEDFTKDVLKTKPPHSRIPKDWIEAGGSIAIDEYGNWIYTDWYGISVKYINGYPDYRGAGAVFQMVNIGRFTNRSMDKRLANKLASNGPCKEGHVWHHSEDGHTMEEISREIHERFTHKGGYSLWKRKE